MKYKPFGADAEEQPTKTKDRQTRTATDRDNAIAEIIWSNLLPPGSFIMTAREVELGQWCGRVSSEVNQDFPSSNIPCRGHHVK